MKLEAIEKEAVLYEGDGCCYIHAEQARGTPLKLVYNGDPNALASAVFCISLDVAEEVGKSPVEIWKFFIKTFRKLGKPECTEINN